MTEGKVENYTFLEEKYGAKRYNIILIDGKTGERSEIENVYSETLEKKWNVVIASSPNPFFKNVVKEINGRTSSYYRTNYGNSLSDKILLCVYILLNLSLQLLFLKRELKEETLGKKLERVKCFWKGGLFTYSIALIICMADVLNNFWLGVIAAVSLCVYSTSSIIFLFAKEFVKLSGDNR